MEREWVYYIECEITNNGQPLGGVEREEKPVSVLTSYVCLKGEEATNGLVNLLRGLLDGEFGSVEGDNAAKYIKREVIEDSKKEKPMDSPPRLVCEVSKKAYVKPSMHIKVYRM